MNSINNNKMLDGLDYEVTGTKDNLVDFDMKITDKIELPLLVIVKYLRNQNGLKHKDFAQYTRYCSRKLHRLRSGLKMKCGRSKFQKSYNECGDYTSHKHLLLLILLIERNWSTGADLGSRTNSAITELKTPNNRGKFYEIRKLRRGCKLSNLLIEVVKNRCTTRSIVEVQAYQSYILGNYYLKCSNWEKGAIELSKSLKLYQQLKLDSSIFEKSNIFPDFNVSKHSKVECVQLYDDQIVEMAPLIRLCLYHCKRLDILVPCCDNTINELKIGDSLANNSNMKFSYNDKEYCVPISNLEILLVELHENYKAVKESIPTEDTEKILKLSSNVVIECFSETLMCSTTLSNKIHEEMAKASANNETTLISNYQSNDWIAFESYAREFNSFVSIERDLIFVFQLMEYFNNPEFYTKLVFLHDENWGNISNELQNSLSKKINSLRYPEEGVRICDILNFNISEITSNSKTKNTTALAEILKVIINNCRSLFLSHCFGQKRKFQEAFVLCDLVKSRLETKEADFSKIYLDKDEIFQRIITLIKYINRNLDDMANKSYNIYLSNVAIQVTEQNKALDYKNMNEILDGETFNPKFLPIQVKPIMFDIASDFISSPDLSSKIKKNGLVNKIFSKATSKFGLFK
ncbi:uncharacterized protein cubi_00245 [Cryptosporidium ubiquitum]|uniref:Signal recognition particle subunit SRP68 n=1 Tax=Cryptosporidium ubiquitum TaxID=857276 RepID=A0A1J4MNU8_9CRYT|nr:uncharacterized protein cubi_00245 [Cryptosporidium ubiquitum]OII74692.1 hypothetical protein cubi_00245 [Cryptosporidium ubiquitum]